MKNLKHRQKGHKQVQTPPSNKQQPLARLVRFSIDYLPMMFILLLILTGGVWVAICYRGISRNNDSNPERVPNESPCKSFTMITGSLTNAERIVLGERHDQPDKTNNCLDILTEGVEHIVLTEGVPIGQVAECELHNIKSQPNRKCIGWDDPKFSNQIEQEALAYLYTQELNLIASTFTQLQYSHAKTDEFLQVEINNLTSNLNDYKIKFVHSDYNDHSLGPKIFTLEERRYIEIRHTLKTFTEIQTLRKQDLNYHQIFFSKRADLERNPPWETNYNLNDSDWAKICLMRNKSFLKALRTFKSKLTVGVAGAFHLKRSDTGVGKAAQYVHDELLKDKDQNPYAILAVNLPQ